MSQCKAMVYVKDVYRREGRGRYLWRMHYNYQRCSRKAKSNGYCWQHQKEREKE